LSEFEKEKEKKPKPNPKPVGRPTLSPPGPAPFTPAAQRAPLLPPASLQRHVPRLPVSNRHWVPLASETPRASVAPRPPAHPLNSVPTPPATRRVRRSLTRAARCLPSLTVRARLAGPSSPHPSRSRNDPEIPGHDPGEPSLPGAHAEITGPPSLSTPRPLQPASNPSRRLQADLPCLALLRRAEHPAPPCIRRFAAPQPLQSCAAVTPRAQDRHRSSQPRLQSEHRRNRSQDPPPVSTSAAAFSSPPLLFRSP
jgi:hypothetical protein